MIKLKNIKIDGNVVKCEIYPEDSKESGYIEVDIDKNSIINSNLPTDYKWCKWHLVHVKKYLIEHFAEIQSESIKEKILVWC